VTAETLTLWAGVLRVLSDARLILLSQPGAHRDRVLQAMEDLGVRSDRIRFLPRVPNADYFQLYHQVDLCLDTVPYTGHTTTLDSLWMGVPVVTMVGQTAVGRGGVSILSNLDLRHLIAADSEDHGRIVTAVAGDLDALSRLRQTLRARMRASPLMDARRFASHLEDAYDAMWTARSHPATKR
jgi:predicted O-linked N-acetylglucosamine transferase (SPINDLY family)